MVTEVCSRRGCRDWNAARSRSARATRRCIATYDAFFTRARLVIVDVTGAVIDKATDLHARYGFKTPDALHLATAIDAKADVFVTGDAAFARCTELPVDIVSPTP
jgi:predicted nucleic acid-binding protein